MNKYAVCETCPYAKGWDTGMAFCVRFPPAIIVLPDGEYEEVLPLVRLYGTCGEHPDFRKKEPKNQIKLCAHCNCVHNEKRCYECSDQNQWQPK